MVKTAVVSRLAEAEARSQTRIQEQVLAGIVAELTRFNGWYDDGQVAQVAYKVGQRVRAGSQAAAGLSDAYVARMVAEMLSESPKPSGVIDLTRPLRRGVTSYEEVYSRAARTVRYFESTGTPRSVAVDYALDRVDAMVQTDLQLARRQQEVVTMATTGEVTGHRRLIHPYRSQGGTCGLCVAASDRVYRVDELRPIHDRCKCTTAPIIGDDDPGATVNRDDLEAIYKAAGQTTDSRALKQVRVKYEDHGELGPRMTNAAHRSRTPGRNTKGRPGSAATASTTAGFTNDELRTTLSGLERSLARFDSPGTRSRVEQIRRELAERLAP